MTRTTPPPRFITKAEACELLHVSESTIERMVRRGALTPYDLPTGAVRYREADVLGLAAPRRPRATEAVAS